MLIHDGVTVVTSVKSSRIYHMLGLYRFAGFSVVVQYCRSLTFSPSNGEYTFVEHVPRNPDGEKSGEMEGGRFLDMFGEARARVDGVSSVPRRRKLNRRTERAP